MLHSDNLSQSSSSTVSITTDTPDYKEKSQATPNTVSVETSAAVDFLSMSDEDLFVAPDDNSVEIEGSMERLEGLLQPMEDGLDSSFKPSEPPTKSMLDSPCNATCHGTKPPDCAEEESSTTTFLSSGRLVQSTETISRLRSPDFMDHLEQYAFHASDDYWDFDKFTGEAVPTNYTEYGSSSEKRDEDTDKDSASYSVKDASIERVQTPTLTIGLSASPPSEGLVSTPTDENSSINITQPERGTVQLNRRNIATSGPRCLYARTTKRKRDSREHIPRPSSSDSGCKSNRKAVKRGNTSNTRGKAKITGPNPLSTGFIIYRFGLKPVYTASHRWSCPFPPHDALSNGACLTSFDIATIRSHIADHVDAYLVEHPAGKLECPRRRTNERCLWADDRGSLKTVGPNTGLPRHVTEVHLQVSAYTCPCGASFSRGTRDQFVRHLRDGHEKKLQDKKKTDPALPEFISVDDPRLIDEEKQWVRSTARSAEEDRGEGSSRGVKRARRF